MDGGSHDFKALMQRLHEGSEEAAREVHRVYGPHLRRVIRRRLTQQLRSKFDSLDFAQDVWTSFFAERSRLQHFEHPEALIAFLANMAYHKIVDTFRQRVQTQKNDLAREHSLDSEGLNEGRNLVARQPTPSQEFVAKETWDRLLADQPEHYRKVLYLLREGESYREIADRLGINEKTVRRVIRKLAPES